MRKKVKLIKALASNIEMMAVPTVIKYEFKIICRHEDLRNLKLYFGQNEVAFLTKRRPYLELIYRAKDDLLIRTRHNSFNIPNLPKTKVFRKAASLALRTRTISNGILNGYKLEIAVSTENTGEYCKFIHPTRPIEILRSASRFGIENQMLYKNIEMEFQRGRNSSAITIVAGSRSPIFENSIFGKVLSSSFEYFVNYFAQANRKDVVVNLVKCLPRWDYILSNLAMFFSDVETFKAANIREIPSDSKKVMQPHPTNYYSDNELRSNIKLSDNLFQTYAVHNVNIRSDGVVTSRNYIVPFGANDYLDSSGDYWPQNVWRFSNSNLVAISNYETKSTEIRTAAYSRVHSNWAHFIEEYLPGIYLLITSNPELPFIMGSDALDAQLEVIKELSDSKQFIALRNESINVETLLIFQYSGDRSKVIQGRKGGNSILDKRIMTSVLARLNGPQDGNLDEVSLFINRTGYTFRKLVNKKKVLEILKFRGIQVIETDLLELEDRISLFKRARLVIAESGAGLANCYFCSSGVSVIELRHHQMINSLEHEALLYMKDLNYKLLPTRRPGFALRLLYGRDSHKVDIQKLQDMIDTSIGGVN